MRKLDRLLQRWRGGVARPWVSPGAKVLDIGCHQGEFLHGLGESIGPSVGMDPLASQQPGDRHCFLSEPFREPAPFPDASFDAIVMLATLEHIGVFSKKLPKTPDKLPKLADFHDKSLPIDVRARSYLHSNCSHCHIKWGGGNAEFKLLVDLPLKEMGIVNVPPQHGNFKIGGAKLLVPGHPDQSIILERMKMTGLGRMPHIASRVVDEQAVWLVHNWIREMK